ncbi:YggS family pyridoxal phosphate-dependent enzyme [Paenibacillus sp. KQZ6P-2]|uniref:Pyridoxal phosphate homeostasis protein n=1 Tax=Paenibacillus mangrovi TaxID=2931978 RepID=A0A9X1WPK1_9BACL|nr:YggS family pyridoxal phosphate-dependent enzyme [Paenibacillus mangrovi]MCJ8011353.1 YggS family pyridoxal phosphate-dependent enzyme [Paenibacillus mangrovi]
MTLEERIQDVNKRIEEACLRSGRSAKDVHIVAVTKYVSTAMTAKVLDSGLEHVGENRWQNAEGKWNELGQRGTWHFIGHLQTNKVKDVIGKFEYIHSLDRMSLAKELEKSAAAKGLVIKTFLQINISGEDSKYGLAPEHAANFLREIQGFNHIKVVGLMTMAPIEDRAEDTRMVFRGLRELRDTLNLQGMTKEPLTELSMGMSNDFEVAVEEGATWIRLGSVLVGKEEEE